MPISVPAFRHCMLLALMLASLIALADGIALYELQQATGGVAFTVAGASDE